MVLHIAMIATLSNGAAIVTPPNGASALCTLKSGYQNRIHQIDITANGKTVHDIQAFSWWDYRGNSWKYNKGLRIDYLLTSLVK